MKQSHIIYPNAVFVIDHNCVSRATWWAHTYIKPSNQTNHFTVFTSSQKDGRIQLKDQSIRVTIMLKDIIEAKVHDGYTVLLRFEDGVEGVVDLSRLIGFEGVFAPLRDRREFARLQVHGELGTICWPNGADLDPDVLYAQVTGQPISLADKQSFVSMTDTKSRCALSRTRLLCFMRKESNASTT
jgi:hypothetical protein